MGLFGGKEKEVNATTLKECEKIIEGFFRKLNMDPNQQRVQGQKGAWFVGFGSAFVYIFVNEFENLNTIRIVSPVLYLPHENLLPFYRACLEINFSMVNCALSIDKNIVYLLSERPLLGLSEEEVEDNIRRLAFYADRYDNMLADEFGAKLYSAQTQ